MVANRNDLIGKFAQLAYKKLPSGCTEIPAVTTCNEEIHLFDISYFSGQYLLNHPKSYRVIEMQGRVAFIRTYLS